MEIIPIKKSDEKSGPTREGLTYKKYFHQGYRDKATLDNVLNVNNSKRCVRDRFKASLRRTAHS